MKKIDLRPVKRSVKKTFVSAAFGASLLAFSVTALASNFTVEFFSRNPQVVDLTIDTIDESTGSFSGEAVGAHNELYEVAGTLRDGKMEIELTSIQGEERIVASGKIEPDGMIAGRAATEAGELFEWEATDALVNPKVS